MKKLTLILPLMMALPATAMAQEAAKTAIQNLKTSGFLDVVYTLADGTDEYNGGGTGDSSVDKKFAVSGELDLATDLNPRTALRLDLDLTTGATGFNPNQDTPDSAIFEQAFFDYAIDQNMKLKLGVFNNPLGFEREDAPDLYQVTHSQLWDIWNTQTQLNGNNLAGAEFSTQVGIVNLKAGLLNDLNNTPEEISFLLAAGIKAMESMDVMVGLITADEGTATDSNAGTIIDASILWKANQLALGGELLTASEVYDMALQGTANYAFTDAFSGTVRIDYVTYEEDFDNSTSISLAGLFAFDEHLYANAELRLMQNDDDAASTTSNPNRRAGEGSMLYLELLGTF